MKISNVLNNKVVKFELESSTKEGVIKELLSLLVASGKIAIVDQAFQDVMDREKQMSTGIQEGVAIPHAKTRAVKDLVAAVGIKKEGLDFDSLDGKPSTIFILTLSPIDRIGPHVQFLAEISKIIQHVEAREELLKATSVEEILKVFGVK
ncbi:MAG: PTS sugar transporter subunit IIA [Spirochaetales bacterium]|nr:PTS sugar transporter subunit IIA [Spirochaetales bacterium]